MPNDASTPASPMRASVRTGAAMATLVFLASCSSGGSGDPDDTGQAAGDDRPSPDAPSSPAPSGEDGESAPITVAIGGDVHFEGELRQRLDADPATALGEVSQTLSAADLSIVNLETAVTDGGTPPPSKGFVFRAPSTAFTALEQAGVDVASVANNHGMDYGTEGLQDTLANAEEADFPIVGAGRDEQEAYEPHIFDTDGGKVAVIGATDVLNTDLIPAWTAGPGKPGLASSKNEMQSRLVEAVSSAADEAETVITYLHWGREGDHCPKPHAPGLAQALADAGSDAVVGGHAHVLSPGGYVGDSYVHYGLGNFAFYNYSGPTAETGVLNLTFQDGEVVGDEWKPGRIRGGVPVLYEGAAAEDAGATWESYRTECTVGLSPTPQGQDGGEEPAEAG
ncbi:CapA family protein [Streptomonospora salina]|uniref:Poly-gamma-glutamate synthesis protein (Capsule biosynthesis protein) n=1 Tax=Streptomonospora salina TaxID=104205 RepID=A0A841E921_9ACTN|nr:CapA family protein [Streptomonospora salina]MBB5998964.1 poly-gamma-glutamate synthesis protein (capsule biosynthesis protein) [Streptomonospora salina]